MNKNNMKTQSKSNIKSILISKAEYYIPDFKFINYKNYCYTFLRQKDLYKYKVSELLHIIFSPKNNYFESSVASRLNPIYVNNCVYNNGLVNPHIDLITLKNKITSVHMEDTYGKRIVEPDKIQDSIDQIFNDFIKYGLTYLSNQFTSLNKNLLINNGLVFINNMDYNYQQLKIEIESELKSIGFLMSRLSHPIYINLVNKLLAIPEQSREDRKEIPRLAYELLELFWSNCENVA